MGGDGATSPGGPVAGGPEDEAKRIQNMPTNIQKDWSELPGKAQKALLRVKGG